VFVLESKLDRAARMGWASIRLVNLVITRLVHKGTRSGIHSSHALTILSSLSYHLVEHGSGLGHLGGVEHQVDVVVLEDTAG
jgi:hypothetical protein